MCFNKQRILALVLAVFSTNLFASSEEKEPEEQKIPKEGLQVIFYSLTESQEADFVDPTPYNGNFPLVYHSRFFEDRSPEDVSDDLSPRQKEQAELFSEIEEWLSSVENFYENQVSQYYSDPRNMVCIDSLVEYRRKIRHMSKRARNRNLEIFHSILLPEYRNAVDSQETILESFDYYEENIEKILHRLKNHRERINPFYYETYLERLERTLRRLVDDIKNIECKKTTLIKNFVNSFPALVLFILT